MPALISTIENFLDIHEKATTSGDFSPNKVMAKKLSMVSLVAMTTEFSMPFLVKFYIFKGFFQLLNISNN